MGTPAARCVGIELSAPRFGVACQALAHAESEALVRLGQCHFRLEDLTQASMEDATVAYCCSTAFPEAMLSRLAERLCRLPALRLWVTLREPQCTGGFELV